MNSISSANPDKVIPFTNLDKVFWPEDGYTKGDLIGYYDKISPYIIPHLLDRPAADLEQSRRAHQVRQALRARDRHVQPVPREQELDSAWKILSARRCHREEHNRRLLALELVHRAHTNPAALEPSL